MTAARYGARVRIALVLFLCLLIAPGTWLRDPPHVPDLQAEVHVASVALPGRAVLRADLGPFQLKGVWHLSSANAVFGSYSGLVPLPGGRLLAISDHGYWLRFSPPGAAAWPAQAGELPVPRLAFKAGRDAEAATIDAASETVWIGWEGRHRISRHPLDFSGSVVVRPPEMRWWGSNTGPEGLVRLRDGRFLVLGEGFTGMLERRRHPALLFPRDPVKGGKPIRFEFDGPDGFSPTDAAQLPDGRVLILMRRLAWPMPFRFTGRIVVADPGRIRPGKPWHGRTVARLSERLPVDNFEGLAIVPAPGGTVTVWIISDDNEAVTQRTLLWKLALDPARLK